MKFSKLKILVVEDHKISQKIALLVLTGLGCDIDCAESGAEALELYARNKYHLIFMDLGLPDIDGLTVTQTIRQLEAGDGINTPIIALTAHSDITFKSRSLEIGINYFLEKPLLRESAEAILKQFISKEYKEYQENINSKLLAVN